MDVAQVRVDLLAEQQELDDIVSGLLEEDWSAPTPSPRWTVAHQIAHLAYFDRSAGLAITDPKRFPALVSELWAAASSDESLDAYTLAHYLAMSPADLLGAWRTDRESLAAASGTLGESDRVPWYGPAMGSKSFLTARLMECWAHGQDIVDALGVERPATDRLRHIAQLGFITRAWSYQNRGLVVPDGEVRVELRAPSGETWIFGGDDARESVVGSAQDFCLVVTQRRHLADTDLVATSLAQDWLLKAQAFAGPATEGPTPGRHRS